MKWHLATAFANSNSFNSDRDFPDVFTCRPALTGSAEPWLFLSQDIYLHGFSSKLTLSKRYSLPILQESFRNEDCCRFEMG